MDTTTFSEVMWPMSATVESCWHTIESTRVILSAPVITEANEPLVKFSTAIEWSHLLWSFVRREPYPCRQSRLRVLAGAHPLGVFYRPWVPEEEGFDWVQILSIASLEPSPYPLPINSIRHRSISLAWTWKSVTWGDWCVGSVCEGEEGITVLQE